LKDAARVLELPDIATRLNKLVPTGDGGKLFSFAQLEDPLNGASAKFRTDLAVLGANGAKVVALAKKMVGTLKGEGIHACGVIISTEPLRGLIPLRRDRSKTGAAGLTMITAWDAPDVGDISGPKGGIGLLKLDVLSIRNLDIVAQSIAFIKETTGEVINPRALPHPNTKGDPRVKATWALLKAGRTAGVFQMDSGGMQNMSRAISPECLTDLSAIVALFRPGPLGAGMDQLYAERKSGSLDVNYDQFTHDPAEQAVIDTILGETYGVWVFQEQLMRLGAAVSGFTAGQRAKLRKAVGKKDKAVMAAVSLEFVTGAVSTDDGKGGTKLAFSADTAERIVEQMQASASYLFNASHSAAYAQLAYTTAFLKANWPAEYGAAILAMTDDGDKRLSAIEALTGEGIEILAPNVNASRRTTAPEGFMKVRLGLTEIKGVGQLGDMVVEARERNGDILFTSLEDLIARLTDVREKKAPSIAAIESLIEAGACDEFGPRLGQLMVSRAVKSNPMIAIPDAEFGVLERSMRQRSLLGVSLGIHPLKSLKADIKAFVMPGAQLADGTVVGPKVKPIDQIPDKNGAPVFVAGLLGQWSESPYSKGRRANITIEGSNIRISGVMWDDALKLIDIAPRVGSVVAVHGTVSIRERDIEDEEGVVIETLVTKELTIRRIFEIPVNENPVGAFVDKVDTAFRGDLVDELLLPEIPVITLLKLPTKAAAARAAGSKPPAAPPRGGGPANASVVVAEVDTVEEPAAVFMSGESDYTPDGAPYDAEYDVPPFPDDFFDRQPAVNVVPVAVTVAPVAVTLPVIVDQRVVVDPRSTDEVRDDEALHRLLGTAPPSVVSEPAPPVFKESRLADSRSLMSGLKT
jgi:DNA polymerase-3 subunit alpha